MSKWEFNHFTNLGHLPLATADVVIADLVELLLVLALHWLTFTVDNRVGCHDAVGLRICLHNLELHRVHGLAHKEEVSLLDRAVGLEEIWLQVNVEQVAGHSLNGVVNGQHMNTLAVWNVTTRVDSNHIAETDAEVLSNDLIHTDIASFTLVVCQHDAYTILASLTFDENSISSEELEFLHLLHAQGNNGVIVVRCLINH